MNGKVREGIGGKEREGEGVKVREGTGRSGIREVRKGTGSCTSTLPVTRKRLLYRTNVAIRAYN